MHLVFALTVLAACTSSPTPVEPVPTPGKTVRVVGVVTSIDRTPMTYDGDAIIELSTDDGSATVHVPARMTVCKASGLGGLDRIRVGDLVDASGELGVDGAVTPCASSDHRLRYFGLVDLSTER